MITKELVEYINENRKKDISDQQIKENLKQIGWKITDINFALEHADKNLPVPPYEPEVIKQKGYQSMWDAFLHIMMFISMYVSFIASQVVIFSYINYFVPERYRAYTYNNDPFSESTWAVAALIVTFPFFAYLFLKIAKKTKEDPMVRSLKSRKILIYGTLIATFVTMIVITIIEVAGLLTGDVTTNINLKLLSVFVVSALVFSYYLNQVKEDRQVNA
ncbi:MAG: DUF5671 domain-containing protein [Patescibacteria group bacterium]